MDFREDLSTSSDYLRKAVPLMVQRAIPPTPYNYALWYAHVQNANPELSRTLLHQFPDAAAYDHDKSEALFFEFFVKNYLPNSPKAQNLLVNIVAHLARTVSKNVKGTQEYGCALREAMDVFDVAVDPQRIRDALVQLLADTAAVEALNQEFQLELHSASLEVEILRKELEKSQHSARIDPLTNIANRRAFNDAIAQSRSIPDNPISLLLLDLDNFKRCNDTYGHLMGDRILEIVGEVLAGVQCESVFVARYGGEEFAVIVHNSASVALPIAEEIRQKVAAIRIKKRNTKEVIGAISVSIGVVQARSGEAVENLIERADVALYRAKANGRNCVVFDGDADTSQLAD
jgi:diguanylate cyclase